MAVFKAILPVAGKGTRVMPLTLHQPKGMIALADKPMIHYIIDELISVGIKEIILVLGPKQKVFKDYLNYLKRDKIWDKIKFNFARQKYPYGNADAIYSAKKFIKSNEDFVVAFCDDLFGGKSPLKKMMNFFEKCKMPILLLEQIPKKEVNRYGVVKLDLFTQTSKEKKNKFYSITDMVEKPKIFEAPSNLTVIGRYIFPYKIFDYIKKLYPFKGREIGITDALKLYINDYQKVWGMIFNGKRFDCGSKRGLIEAQAYFSLNHPEIKIKI